MLKLQKQLDNFTNLLASKNVTIDTAQQSEEITFIANALHESNIEEPIERAVTALLAFHNYTEPEAVEELVEEVELGNLTIFTPLRYPEKAPPILVKDIATFSQALLDINDTRNSLMNIERLIGEKDKLAGNIANEIIKDFKTATSYPPVERDRISAAELTDVVKQLCEKIVGERERIKSKQEAT